MKIFNVKKSFVFITFVLFFSLLLPAQTETYKSEYELFTDGLNLDHATSQQVWDAVFMSGDFKNPGGDLKNPGTLILKSPSSGSNADMVYFQRTYSDKVKRLEDLLRKKGGTGDVALVLGGVLWSGGEESRALKLVEQYISNAESAAQYSNAADFYSRCLLKNREVNALFSGVGKCDKAGKIKFYRRIIDTITAYDLDPNKLDRAYDALVRISENREQVFNSWLGYYKSSKNNSAVSGLIDKYSAEYPGLKNYFLSKKAELYFDTKRISEGISLYSGLLDAREKPGYYEKYFNTLKKAGVYNSQRRGLFKKWKAGSAGLDELFTLHRMYSKSYNNTNSRSVLKTIREKVKSTGYREKDLHGLAVASEISNMPEEALKIYYSLERKSDSRDSRLRYLGKIEELYFTNYSLFSSLYRGLVSGWGFALTADNMPSVFGGILSLLYNGDDFGAVGNELENVLRISQSRKIIFMIHERLMKDYPDSHQAQQSMLHVAKIYHNYKLYDKSIAAAGDFERNFPDSSLIPDCSDILISNYLAAKNDPKVLDTYTKLLKWFRRKGMEKQYWKYFDARRNWLVGKKDFVAAVKYYWEEINAYPDDREIYDKFLSFIDRYNYDSEELKVYQKVLSRFNEPKWSHKIARWYIRKNQWNNYKDFTERILSGFSDSELKNYLSDFESSVPSTYAPTVKRNFYLKLYKYSVEQYPFNRFYIKGLINYYAYYGPKSELVKFAKKYFFLNEGCRRIVLSDYFKDSSYRPADSGRAPGADGSYGALASQFLAAYNSAWFSDYEKSYIHLKSIAKRYGDNRYIQESLASLSRSLNKTAEAVEIYKTLAERNPANVDYLTRAGETLADRYEMKEAASYWNKILLVKPRDPETYHSVAAIFWDYYMFDRAAEIFKELRVKLDKPYLHAEKLAAVYESAKNYKAAVREYMGAIKTSDYYYWNQVDRLIHLANKRKLGDEITRLFFEFTRKYPENNQLFRAATHYFDRLGDRNGKLRFYERMIDITEDRSILTDIYYFFQGIDNRKQMDRVMLRKLEISENEPWVLDDTIAYFEDIRNYQQAEKLLRQKLELSEAEADEFPDKYITSLEQAYRYYQRRSNYTRANAMLSKAIDYAYGPRKRNLQVRLARLMISNAQYKQAEEILKNLTKEYPGNITYVNALAEIYTARGDFTGLVKYYTDAIVGLKKSSINPGAKIRLIASLRKGLITGYKKLGRKTEALDQYIELVNREPEDNYLLQEAYQFARDNNLLPRLTGYYEKTSAESFKDYHWQAILGYIYSQSGELEKAVSKYKLAIENEPQKTELYYSLADIYNRKGDYSNTAKVYGELYELSEDYTVLLKQADMLKRDGRDKEAVAAARRAVSSTTDDYQAYFRLARLFEGWGEYSLALEPVRDALKTFRSSAARTTLSTDQLDLYARISMKNSRGTKAFFDLFILAENLEEQRAKARKNRDYNSDWYLNTSIRNIKRTVENKLGPYFREYATNAELGALEKNIFSGRSVNLLSNRYRSTILSFANKSGLVSLQEKILEQDKRNWIQLQNFYRERRRYGKMINWTLKNKKGSSDYHYRTVALLYRATGDVKKERGHMETYLQKYSNRSRNTAEHFNNYYPFVWRFFELSLKDPVVTLPSILRGSLSVYTGNLVNLLLYKGDYDRALSVISANPVKQPGWWLAAKKAQILSMASKFDKKLASDIRKILNITPLASHLGTKPWDNPHLWYRLAAVYAEFLSIGRNAESSDRYMPSMIEEQPKSAERQMMTGDVYYGLKRFKKAEYHYRLARQLDKNSGLLLAKLGAALNMQGQKQQAFETWKGLISKNKVSNYEYYMKVLADNGYAGEGARAYLDKIRNDIKSGSFNDSIFNLLKKCAKVAYENKLPFDVSSETMNVLNSKKDVIWYMSALNMENLLNPADQRTALKEVINLIRNSKTLPRSQLKRYYDLYLANLSQAKRYDEALKFLESLRLEDKKNTQVWIISQLIRFRAEKGMKPVLPGDADAYLKEYNSSVYRVILGALRKADAEKERNALALKMYVQLIFDTRNVNNTNLYGLAEEYFIAGRTADAEKTVKRLTSYKSENPDGLRMAAELLEKYNRIPKALSIRQNIEKIVPDDMENVRHILMDYVELGRNKEARAYLDKIFLRRGVARNTREKAADYLVKKIKEKSPLRGMIGGFTEYVRLKKTEFADENVMILSAYSAIESGKRNIAKQQLGRVVKQQVINGRATKELADIFAAENNWFRAVALYKEALDSAPNDKEILLELFKLYYRMGDMKRAVKMTEDYDYFEELVSPNLQRPNGFIPVYEALERDPEKMEIINMMKNAARSIGSLQREQFYHSLLLPFVKDNPPGFKEWQKESYRLELKLEKKQEDQKKYITLKWDI